LLSCGIAQDVAHARGASPARRALQRLGRRQLIAGFEVSINCRFWVSTEAVFGGHKLADMSGDAIKGYLRYRLRQRVKRKTRAGIVEREVLKPSTVHQEFRVLRRILNVAVRKRLLPANPCWAWSFQ
jgi:hypothetical protein